MFTDCVECSGEQLHWRTTFRPIRTTTSWLSTPGFAREAAPSLNRALFCPATTPTPACDDCSTANARLEHVTFTSQLAYSLRSQLESPTGLMNQGTSRPSSLAPLKIRGRGDGVVVRSQVRVPAALLHVTTLGKLFTHNVPLFTKQYKLVPAIGWEGNRRSGVHWPCVTDSVVFHLRAQCPRKGR